MDVLADPADLPISAAPAQPRYRWSLAADTAALQSASWVFVLAAAALAGLVLLLNSRFACTVLGHRRTTHGLRFNDREHQWVSTCRRCKVELCRDAFGDWLPLSEAMSRSAVLQPVAPRKLNGSNGARPVFTTAGQNGRPGIPQRLHAISDEPHVTNAPVRDSAGAHTMVAQLLDNVLGGNAAPPGARGALFFVVDQLRGKPGMDQQARLAEEISIEIQHLQSALQRGAQEEVALVRRQLSAAAGEWAKGRAQPLSC